MTAIRPLDDWVLIDRPRSPNLIGSICLPTQTGRTKPEFGTVIATGPGRKRKKGFRDTMPVKAGDKVTFRRFDLEKIKGLRELEDANGNPYIFVRARDLYAIIEPAEGDIFTVRTVSK